MYDILNTIYYEFDFEMGITNIINSKISMCVKVQVILVSGTLIMIDSVIMVVCIVCDLSPPAPEGTDGPAGCGTGGTGGVPSWHRDVGQHCWVARTGKYQLCSGVCSLGYRGQGEIYK